MGVSDADFVLKDRGTSHDLEEFVVAVAFLRDGTAAFALGDGTLRVAPSVGEWRRVEAHDGGILSMAAAGDAWMTGGDDGRFQRTDAAGVVSEVGALRLEMGRAGGGMERREDGADGLRGRQGRACVRGGREA